MKTRTPILILSAGAALLIPLASCTLLHRQHATSRTESTDSLSLLRQASAGLHQSEQHLQLRWLRDSSSSESFIEIIPSGNFEFSPQQGFKGHARSIRLYGRQREGSQLRDSTVSSSSLNALKEQKEEQKASHSQKQQQEHSEKKKAAVPFWFWMLLIIPAVLLIRIILTKVLLIKAETG